MYSVYSEPLKVCGNETSVFQEKKDDEVPEEEVEMPSVKRLMLLNSTEWPYLAIGSFFAAIVELSPSLLP